MFKLLKKIIVLILVIAGMLYIMNYQWKGKTIKQHVIDAYRSGLVTEGVKDLKTWTGDLVNVGKKVTSDNITAKDKEKMENVIKNELRENIMKLKAEAGDSADAKKREENKKAGEKTGGK